MEALKAALAARGIGMNIALDVEGKSKGVVFTCDNLSFAGYQIDRFITYATLPKSGYSAGCRWQRQVLNRTGRADGTTRFLF